MSANKKAAITFFIPCLPVSVNKSWMRGRRTVFKNPKTKEFTDQAFASFYQSGNKKISGPVSVELTYVPKDRRFQDVDNILKQVLDSLKDIAFEDDRMIEKVSVERTAPNKDEFGIGVYIHQR